MHDLSYRLEPTGDARRNRAIATQVFPVGNVILSVRPLATVLLPCQKGRRCDYCLRRLSSTQRCSACKEYWYCDCSCQEKDWKERHRRTCNLIRSSHWQGVVHSLSPLDLLDGQLLIHLFAAHYKELLKRLSLGVEEKTTEEELLASDHCSLFLHLLPAAQGRCLQSVFLSNTQLQEISQLASWEPHLIRHALYLIGPVPRSRFRNNNFEITSGVDGFAHGIFPLTSRSFNHSCFPNAIAVYSVDAAGARQDVMALKDIAFGEEISLSYLDPAMSIGKRQAHLKEVYNFDCDCPRCDLQLRSVVPNVLDSKLLRNELEAELRTIAESCNSFEEAGSRLSSSAKLGVYDESYLSSVAETFSRLSHEGPYLEAIQIGQVLLGIYKAIYPSLYPLIGFHELELAKTHWNAIANNEVQLEDRSIVAKIHFYLKGAEAILRYVAQADREGGWGAEVARLEAVLAQTELRMPHERIP